VPAARWRRRPRIYKLLNWLAYGVVRVAMGMLGYGRDDWFRRRRRRKPHPSGSGSI
jgi:hypothetical protein